MDIRDKMPNKFIANMIKALRSFGRNNLIVFSICLFFSFIFWGLMVFREENIASIDFPVRYSHIPDQVILIDSLPASIPIVFKDKGSVIWATWLKRNELEINLDFRKYKEVNQFSISGSQLEAIIQRSFGDKLKANLHSVPTIQASFITGRPVRVPVHLPYSVHPDNGYILSGKVLIEPSTVIAYMPDTMVRSYQKIICDSIVFKNLNTRSSQEICLPCKNNYVKFVPNRVRVTIPIDKAVEKSFDITIIPINVPSGMRMKTFPQTVDVKVRMPMEQYKKIEKSQFEIVANYRKLEDGSSIDIEMRNKPKWVEVILMKPKSIDVVVETR